MGSCASLDFPKPATTLLTNICTYNSILPQGAPTSPQISNLMMKRFDERIGKWCGERGINYTRYCDDMTFSGGKAVLNAKEITQLVSRALRKMGFKLNMKKIDAYRFIATSAGNGDSSQRKGADLVETASGDTSGNILL